MRIKEQKYNYTSLCIDDENILWRGNRTGLYQWKNQSSVFISNTANLHITAIVVNNHLVFGTIDGGIYVYSKTQHTLNFHGNLSSEISSIFYDGKAEIGISTKGMGFSC